MNERPESILKQKLIFKKFKLLKLLAISNFSSVYEGKNIATNIPVAIKIEKEGKYNFLESEAYIFMIVKGIGIPKLMSFGKIGHFKILVEEFLGKNIETLWESCPFKNDPKGQNNKYIKDICLLAIQGLERLKYIHNKNTIHRDIKTKNFMTGNNDINVIYLIDFGFAKKYRSSRTGKHIRFSNLNHLIGSWNFASHNAIRVYESNRRDDLESFGYTLIYLAKSGWTPWNKYYKIKNITPFELAKIITKIKLEISEENLCKGLPNEFIEYMKYVKKLEFEQEPDYKYLNGLFLSILSKNEMKRNIKFFWIKQKSIKPAKNIRESYENKSRNIILEKSNKNSSKIISAYRLYNTIKKSLSNNLLNENSIKKYNKNEEKINLHFKMIKDDSIDRNNYYFAKNYTSTEKSRIKSPISNINYTSTIILNNSKKIKNTINNAYKSYSSMLYKFKSKINGNNLFTLTNATYNHNMNLSSINNIKDKKIFQYKYNAKLIKTNIPRYIGLRKNNIKKKEITLNTTKNLLCLKKNIIYKPVFTEKIKFNFSKD